MKSVWLAIIVALLSTGPQPALGKGLPDKVTARWDQLVKKHVRPTGGVDYASLSRERAALQGFIAAYDRLDLQPLSDAEKTAALINLYNATMMENILRYAESRKIDPATQAFTRLRVDKIEVPGGNIWNGDYKVRIGGIPVHLDDIEHGLIRGQASGTPLAALKVRTLDARIHAAVNCAALSCPPVRREAYTAANLDRLLTENMVQWVNDNRQFRKRDDGLRANSIVFWYYGDFEQAGRKAGLKGAGSWLAGFLKKTKDLDWKRRHLQEHLNNRNKAALYLDSDFKFHYEWLINDTRNITGSSS